MLELLSKMIKLSITITVLSVKMNTHLKSCVGNGTFELGYGTTKLSTMEKR
jgi:hypothetical protein